MLEHMGAPGANVAAAADGQTALEDQSSLLDHFMANMAELEKPGKRYDYALHQKSIELCETLGPDMADMLETSREMMADVFPLQDAFWLRWIENKDEAFESSQSIEDAQAVLDLYARASKDYASIPIQLARLHFVTAQHHLVRGWAPPRELDDEANDPADGADIEMSDGDPGEPAKNPDLADFFDEDRVRDVAAQALAQVGFDLVESSKVWNVLRDFELDLLRRSHSDAEAEDEDPDDEQAAEVQAMFEARLEVPHMGSEATFAAFSRFTTKYNNEHYEQAMVAAQKFYGVGQRKLNEREPQERKLANAGYSLEAYQAYIAWELQVKKPDVPLVTQLFERAIRQYYSSPEIWSDYGRFISTHATDPEAPLEVARRAVKNVPWSGETWALAIRIFEHRHRPAEEVEALCEKAIETGLLDKNVEGLVAWAIGRAGYHRRRLDALVVAGEDDPEIPSLVKGLEQVLADGIERVRKASKEGDPSFRLEKYLTGFLESHDRAEGAVKLWQKATKQHRSSSAAWLAAADFETRRKDYAAARVYYQQAVSAKLDYPEYLLQAWVTFENQYGDLKELETAMNRVKGLMRGINARRQREAEAAAAAPVESASAGTGATVTDAAPVAGPSGGAAAGALQSSAVAADGVTRKRPAEDASPEATVEASDAKRAKTEHAPTELKRDREHTTVLVNGLLPSTTEADIRNLFQDCGEIREVVLQQLGPNETVGTVEFMSRESVLPAQTKDKKRIGGKEIDVNLAWQSTLYITSFPESADDAAIRSLFSKYGTILDVRWPSKRFKSTRRFCYVQYILPAYAQAALELHGHEMEPGQKLNVYISDPERKKARTDAKSNEREVYIAGLSKFTKEADLVKLFSPYGALKAVRLMTDADGNAKGFAFVEFETEESAQAALALHNHELRKRHISVTIADKRGGAVGTRKTEPSKGNRVAEAFDRSVKVRGLADGTQEAIIEQTFAKFGKVKLVILKQGANEAIVEFENGQDVGKVLMLTEPVEVAGTVVQISAATANPAPPPKQGPSGGGEFVPRFASRGRGRGRVAFADKPRPGLGAGRGGSASTISPANGAGNAAKGQDAFRAMLDG